MRESTDEFKQIKAGCCPGFLEKQKERNVLILVLKIEAYIGTVNEMRLYVVISVQGL